MVIVEAQTLGSGWLEVSRRILADGSDAVVVYAHSLDFGKKAYGNLVELARLQHEVAAAVGV